MYQSGGKWSCSLSLACKESFTLLRFFFGVADHCQNNLRLSHYLPPDIAPVLKNSADSFALLAKATQWNRLSCAEDKIILRISWIVKCHKPHGFLDHDLWAKVHSNMCKPVYTHSWKKIPNKTFHYIHFSFCNRTVKESTVDISHITSFTTAGWSDTAMMNID